MFRCPDGYTAPVPLEDAMADDSIIAFKMNGRDIPQQQGYPCRPFISHLYGWKSAKWMDEIEFLPSYVDGYWEMYGYNERGDSEKKKGSRAMRESILEDAVWGLHQFSAFPPEFSLTNK